MKNKLKVGTLELSQDKRTASLRSGTMITFVPVSFLRLERETIDGRQVLRVNAFYTYCSVMRQEGVAEPIAANLSIQLVVNSVEVGETEPEMFTFSDSTRVTYLEYLCFSFVVDLPADTPNSLPITVRVLANGIEIGSKTIDAYISSGR